MRVALISEVPKSHPQLDNLAGTVCSDFYSISNNFSAPAYKKFFRALWLALKIPKHDAYIVHETFGLFICVLKKKLKREKCKVVMRVMNDFFCFERFPWYKRWFNRWLSKSLDGCIPTTDMVLGEIRKNSDIPAITVYEFLLEKECLKSKPNFSSKTLVCLAHGDYKRKGVDIVIETFKILKSENLLDRCYILGDVHGMNEVYKKSLEKDNIFFIFFGSKVNMRKYLERSWLYIQPSRYDAGASALLAVMAAGCIPIVSTRTGNKSIVERIDKNLIINGFKPESYADKIKDYIKMNKSDLKMLSNKFKKLIASDYLLCKQQEKFKKAFYEMVA